MQALVEVTSWETLIQTLTVFAADFLLHRCIHNEAELMCHLQCCGLLLDILDRIGLEVNLSKSFAMLSLWSVAKKTALWPR